jgi:hypothetical protein
MLEVSEQKSGNVGRYPAYFIISKFMGANISKVLQKDCYRDETGQIGMKS